MSVKILVQEAMNKNVLGFEGPLKAELRNRISLALEAKMNDEEDSDGDGILKAKATTSVK